MSLLTPAQSRYSRPLRHPQSENEQIPKPRRRPGYCLFIDRIKREGKHPRFRELCREGLSRGEPLKTATINACKAMGYKNPAQEHALNDDFMAFGTARLVAVKEDFELDEVDRQRENIDLRDKLGEYDIDASDLPTEIAFVFHSLHKAKGEEQEWLITPEDAPNPGAWNMLVWAVDSKNKFFELVIREQLKGSITTDEGGMGDTGESVAQIDKLLGELTDG